jgi:hypothetical protein
MLCFLKKEELNSELYYPLKFRIFHPLSDLSVVSSYYLVVVMFVKQTTVLIMFAELCIVINNKSSEDVCETTYIYRN